MVSVQTGGRLPFGTPLCAILAVLRRWAVLPVRRRLIAMVPAKPAQMSADLRAAMDSVFVAVRVDAVRELERWLHSRRPRRGLAAEQALRKLAQDDSRQVATAASTALDARSRTP